MRRSLMVAFACCAGVLGATVGQASAATESLGWQVDAAHTGYLYGAGVAPPLTSAWSADLGGWTNTAPAIDDGHVFVLGRTGPDPDNQYDPYLESISLATGAVAWRESVPDGSVGYLTVDDGRVFEAEQGDVLAFDEATGAPLWSHAVDQWAATPPLTRDGVLYVSDYGEGGNIYAFDERSGTQLWQSPEMMEAEPIVMAGPQLVAAGICDWSVGFAPATGEILWHNNPSCDGGGEPMASYDGTRVWGEDSWGGDGADSSTFYDPATGEMTGHFGGYAPAFGYGEAVQAYLGGNNGPTEIRAVDPDSAAVRWSFAEPTEKESTGTEPLLADGSVFAEGPEGQVWALDPCTGDVQWQSQVASPPQYVYEPLVSLAAGDGYLVVPTASGLAAFKGSGTPSTVPDCATGTLQSPGDPSGTTTGGGSASGGSSGAGTSAPGAPATVTAAPADPAPVTSTPSGPSGPLITPATPAMTSTARVTGPPMLTVLHDSCRAGVRSCEVTIAARQQGAVTVRLVFGGRVVARARTDIRRRARVRLRVAHALRIGRFHLELTFSEPTGSQQVR